MFDLCEVLAKRAERIEELRACREAPKKVSRMYRRCPSCNGMIWVGEHDQTVICRHCGDWCHPEHTKPLGA